MRPSYSCAQTASLELNPIHIRQAGRTSFCGCAAQRNSASSLAARRQSSYLSCCSTSEKDNVGGESWKGLEAVEGNRRQALFSALAIASLAAARPAHSFTAPPQGYRLLRDRLDGYSFLLPESWTPLSSSGNDIFYRNPFNVNENLFVNISSPSSSRYNSIEDLKSPEAAAKRTKEQYVQELMSTRLGVKRTADVISASERIAPDGKKYFDVELEAQSYASRNQLAVSQKQINDALELEWDRRYITVLGVANRRLYEFRLQTASDTYDQAKDTLQFIAQSFRCSEVDD